MAATRSTRGKSDSAVQVTVKPFGPTAEALAAIGAKVMALAGVRLLLGRAKGRLLYVEALDDESGEKPGKPRPPTRFRATIRDDAAHRTLLVDGELDDPGRASVVESALPPPPSDAEFAAAVKLAPADNSAAQEAFLERVLKITLPK